MSELSDIYFKTGNSQAGNTYRKVIKAILLSSDSFVICILQAAAAVRSHNLPISSGAAVSKGKNKIDGIGAKCGELIDEFLSTGTISKIAEKKASFL